MKNLFKTMSEHQAVNIEQDGISFTKEEFTQLYEGFTKCVDKHMDEKDDACRNGIMIGAITVGLTLIGGGLCKKLIEKGISKL